MAEKSGLYYPNKIGRIYLMAMEEVMGTNGIKAVLNLAKVPELIGNYPPNNLARELTLVILVLLVKQLRRCMGLVVDVGWPCGPAEPHLLRD